MRYTLILVPETATGHVRRLRVERLWLGVLLGGALVFAAASGLVTAQYLEARRQLAELPALHAERAAQSEELRRYGEEFARIEGELQRVHEFERKLRIISDLPLAVMGEAPAVESGMPGTGVGGGADDALESGASLAAAQLAERQRRAEAAARGAALARQLAAQPVGVLELGEWHALLEAASALAGALDSQQGSLAQLAVQLENKVDRLASTPSIWPTRGWVTSRFGTRISPFTGNAQHHPGLDIASEPGTRIVAPARGVVVFAGVRGALGNTVVLDHGSQIESIFGHAQQLFVKTGDRVERGQQIAAVGNSGRSTGPHLHYSVEVNGRTVDPIDYILD
jgi:murein DD-endopeptidase MepM/ murein hydrolase activator NlpD